jgi:hypothetical protein
MDGAMESDSWLQPEKMSGINRKERGIAPLKAKQSNFK